jgi:hypothetical protein
MNNEFETNEPNVKVELHFHVSLAAPPRPDWTAWTRGDLNAQRFSSELPGKSRWVAKSFGVFALFVAAVVGVSFVHRVMERGDNQADLVSALAPHLRLPPSADMANVEKSVAGVEALQGGAEGPRRGTSAFGLH